MNAIEIEDAAMDVTAGVALIDQVRAAPTPEGLGRIVELLSERHPVHAGRGAAAVTRLRGYVLASFARTGLPEAAWPFVLDALQNGNEPYLVAAAARALRGAPSPEPWLGPFVTTAARTLRNHDDTITFDAFGPVWPLINPTTAVGELKETIAWLGPAGEPAAAILRGDWSDGTEAEACCASLPDRLEAILNRVWTPGRRASILSSSYLFEDQHGAMFADQQLFVGKPSVVVFFYTRCMNAARCSLTVATLARLQAALDESGWSDRVRTLAITYDPEYDTSARLQAYCAARGMRFDENRKALRVRRGFETLLEKFAAQVNFTDVTVNQHAIEVAIVDAHGRIAANFTRLRWDAETVHAELARLLDTEGRTSTPHTPRLAASRFASTRGFFVRVGTITSLPLAIGALCLPRCPLCWASWLALLGIPGLTWVPYGPWARYGACVLVIANLAVTIMLARRARPPSTTRLAIIGSACLFGAVGILSNLFG